jgi:AcrR family transcriptional regulator
MIRQDSPDAMQTRSGQARKKRGDGGERRDEILVAARALFARDGADRTTMRSVADAVGISAAAVYGYFPDKTSLYDATAEAAFQELGRRFAAAAATEDPVARLRAMMLAYVRFGEEHADAYAIAFSPSIDHRPGPTAAQTGGFAKQAGGQTFDAFHSAVADVPGLGGPDSSERLARVIWAAGHGLVVLRRSKADALPDPIELYVDSLFQMIMAHALVERDV